MRSTTAAIAILSAAFLQLSNPTSLPGQESGAGASSAEARALVSASLDAMGGEALANLETLSYDVVGDRYWLGQGRRPETEARMPTRGHVRVDWEGGRVRQGTATYQGDEVYFCFDGVMSPGLAFQYECVTRIQFPVSDEGMENRRQRALAGLPQPRGSLNAMLENETLRSLGEREVGGVQYLAVGYENGQASVTAYFDPRTKLLARVEGSPTEMLLRSETFSESYADYETFGGITIPTRYTAVRPRGGTIGSVIRDEYRFVDVRVNEPFADSTFATQSGLHRRSDDGQPSVDEVADGVFFLRNIRPNYNQLFVEFSDFVLVVDAPYDGDLSTRAMELIRERIPDKPIRYVVPTHTHYDHMGGIPAYVAEGATVITTAGNRDFIAEVLRRALSDQPGMDEPPVTAIGRRFVIEGEGQTVELYDIGPNPHADELLLVYIPEHRILYVADVFSADWGRVRPAIPETMAFAASLEELGLDVEVLLPGHGAQSTIDDLRRALAEGGAASD